MGLAFAVPLVWPEEWPRTPAAKRQASKAHVLARRVRGRIPLWSFNAARDALVIELDHLGARSAILSADLPPNYGMVRLYFRPSTYPSPAKERFAAIDSVSITLFDGSVTEVHDPRE